MKIEKKELVFLSTEQISCETGVSDATLQYWARTGLIDPAVYKYGRGTTTMGDKKNLHELQVLAQLRHVMSLQALRKAVKYLRSIGHNPMSRGQFAVIDAKKRILIKIIDQQVLQTVGIEQGQLLLPMGEFEE